MRKAQKCPAKAVWGIKRFGHPNRFVSVSVAFVEEPPFAEGERQPDTTQYSGKYRDAEPLTGQMAF
jgi:hypothetical protein